MRLFLFAFVLALLFLGCSDGKFNLSLVLWGADEDTEEEYYYSSSSGNSLPPSSSSSSGIPPVSSSLIPSSSGEETSSSSSEEPPPSSSSRPEGIRSSSSKPYEDYDPVIPGAPGTEKGWATRYWDACKPHCSWLQHNFDVNNPKPWSGICKNCNKNNEEITTYEEHETKNDYFAGAVSTKSACDNDDGAYTCWDMAPIAINDTLAYGFAAMNPAIAECGSCYQLTFDGEWYDEDMPRPTHRAIKGKTMIVMASNVGEDVKYNVAMKHGGEVGSQFDIMIPGGGVGAFNALTKQIGVPVSELGVGYGGNLSNCIEGKLGEMFDLRDGSHRATLEQWQECLRSECERVFGNNNMIPGKTYSEELYRGCMWQADWFMAADNPTLYYKKVDCPKYLTDKYYSTINTEPPPLPDPVPMMFMIEGNTDYKQTGWYD